MVKNFKELSRQNTGKHMCDSGDFLGRQYEKDLPKRVVTLHNDGDNDFYATIALGEYLDMHCEINVKLYKQWNDFLSKNKGSWIEVLDQFMSNKGYEQIGCDNSYNNENDLDQDFQFFVYLPKGENDSDWFFNPESVMFIQTHNGCDIRGGYSEPVPVHNSDGTFSALLDLVVGWEPISVWDKEGKELNTDDMYDLCSRFEIGYSDRPTYEVQKEIEIVEKIEENHVTLLLKTGHRAILKPFCREY